MLDIRLVFIVAPILVGTSFAIRRYRKTKVAKKKEEEEKK